MGPLNTARSPIESRMRRIHLILLALAVLIAQPAHAQTAPGISGTVIDGQEPIAEMMVILEGSAGSAFPPVEGGFLSRTRSTATDSAGEYRFFGHPARAVRHASLSGQASTAVRTA
jgi:hypothetical protein